MTNWVRDYDARTIYLAFMVTRPRRRPRSPLYIKEWMRHRGLSIGDMADKMEIAPESVHRMIREPTRLNMVKIAKIAVILDVEPWELWKPPGQIDLNAIVGDSDEDLRARAAEIVRLLVRSRS